MILRSMHHPTRAARAAALGLAVLLLSGCLEKRLQWSPDGARAALYTRSSVYVCNAEGRLTHQLDLPEVHAVAWIGDSERLAIAASFETEQPGLVIAEIQCKELRPGPPIYRGSSAVDIRVAPGDRHLAFTVQGTQSDELELLVVPTDGSAPAGLVSRRAAAYPDWTPDGHALVYLEASERPESAGHESRLGALVQREVVDATGQIRIADETRDLAVVMFAPYARVRCLGNGRVLFTAAEFILPYASADGGGHREQLFAVEPGRLSTLVRLIPRAGERSLPEHLGFFEVSPDESQVLFGTEHGEVCLLALAAGEVHKIQVAATGESKDKLQGAPVWRANGELSYVKRRPATNGSTLRPAEVVLRRGIEETVLSSGWPDEMLADLVEWEH